MELFVYLFENGAEMVGEFHRDHKVVGLMLRNEKLLQIDRQGQCDQIGRFLKVLDNKLAYKCSPKTLSTFWAILKRSTLCKNVCGMYLGNFWEHFYSNIWSHLSGTIL